MSNEVETLIARLAVLRPDLAVLPRVLSDEAAFQGYHALEQTRERDTAAYAGSGVSWVSTDIQDSFNAIVSHCELEGQAAPIKVDGETLAARTFMSKLVEEYPAEGVIHRTMSGSYTGREMASLISSGHPIGTEYATAMLRVCRDLLTRQAEK